MNAEDARVGGGEGEGRGGGWFTWFLVVAVVGLGVLCVLLVRQNRALKRELMLGWEARVAVAREEGIKAGEMVGKLELVGRDGEARRLGSAEDGGEGGPALVFVVGGACGYCEQAAPVWDQMLMEMGLTGERGGGQVRIAAVQTDAREPADLKVVGAAIPVYCVAGGDGRSTWLRRVTIEPAAVLIDGRGRVIKAWLGIPEAVDTADIRQTLLDALTSGGA